MEHKTIRLPNSNLLIETEVVPRDREDFKLLSAKPKQNPVAQIGELLEQIVQPIAKAHEKLSEDLAKLDVSEIEIKLAAGFKGEGRLCILSGTAEASVQISFVCRRRG